MLIELNIKDAGIIAFEQSEIKRLYKINDSTCLFTDSNGVEVTVLESYASVLAKINSKH